MTQRSGRFDAISPLDYRYYDSEVAKRLSAEAFTGYLLRVELAHLSALCDAGVCTDEVCQAALEASQKVTTEAVYAEEDRIHHDIRALVNVFTSLLPPDMRQYVHLGATSYDIIDTANALRMTEVMDDVIIPRLIDLLETLVAIAKNEALTIQIGRTHGQHAVPVTFGFTVCGYINRLGNSINMLTTLTGQLVGKFSGAVGSYNAMQLVVDDGFAHEQVVMSALGLSSDIHSTQIAPPEPMMRLMNELAFTGGILANIARDMRHLQRTEINEVGEVQGRADVGSSTMPHKKNPITFEQIESQWKVLVGRMVTVMLDQISEHQRDLTGSASGRTMVEIVAYLANMITRLNRAMRKLAVNRRQMSANVSFMADLTMAEPLYILLAKYGHPDAHEAVRLVTNEMRRSLVPNETLLMVAQKTTSLEPYLRQFQPAELQLFDDPTHYLGQAVERTRAITEHWIAELGLRV
ncbi:adenylosuccinate lyase [candidate division WWE3 bacterium]|nr:adenylosuccinate lyase [candidate division WWE3 bacterium]